MAIEVRELKTNERFAAEYHGTRYVLKATKLKEKDSKGEDKFTFAMVEPVEYKAAPDRGSLSGGDDGKTFTSLSAAASAIAYPGRWDGWKFWTREKEWKPELAIRARGETLKGKPRPARKAKAEGAPKGAKEKSPKATSKTEGSKRGAVSSKTAGTTKATSKATPKAEGSTKTATVAKPKGKAPAAVAATSKSNGAAPAKAESKSATARGKSEPIEELDI